MGMAKYEKTKKKNTIYLCEIAVMHPYLALERIDVQCEVGCVCVLKQVLCVCMCICLCVHQGAHLLYRDGWGHNVIETSRVYGVCVLY